MDHEPLAAVLLMCGIAGLVCGRADCTSDHEAAVAELCDLQAYRGPDDSGVESLGRVCLGSGRLSILDLTPAGHMPMSDPTGRWWITYNGEVYNYRDLRTELEHRGHRFISDGDTEIVLHAWMEWGEAAFDRFVGMFALALLDRESGALTLARDRYGIKPLYYTNLEEHFLFSSELKTLGRLASEPAVDRQRLIEWFLYRNVDAFAPQTLLRGVQSVLAGEVVHIRDGVVTRHHWYRPVSHVSRDLYEANERARPSDLVRQLESLLHEAVRSRLVSDVPVGTLCSGGLDSSLITALAGETRKDIKAFHVAVEDAPAMDERRFAERLTSDLGIELVSHSLSGDSFRRDLTAAVYHSDLPLTHPNSVAYLQISRVARQHGVVVLLSGEGADELFGGYEWSYRRLRRLERLRPLLRLLPHRLREQFILLAYATAGLPATAHRFRETLPATVDAVDGFARTAWLAECQAAYGFVEHPTDRLVLGKMLADLKDFLSPLLRRLDRMTMAASVECRVPFLDHRVVHAAINLPLRCRVGVRADKWLLKQVAARYLPRTNVWRRKMGFPIPLGEYIAPLADPRHFDDGFCERTLRLSRAGLRDRIDHCGHDPFGFFGLLTLEMWGRMFVHGQQPEEVQADFAPRSTTAVGRVGGDHPNSDALGSAKVPESGTASQPREKAG